ncbi:MAG: electron transfer flavoprotein subunit alpha/FixB family protein [Thermoplasmata archaeon]
MSPSVLVVGELQDGHVIPASREAIGVARVLAPPPAEVAVLLVGSRSKAAAAELGGSGANRLLVQEEARLDAAPAAAVAHGAASAAEAVRADLVLVGGTTFGRDLTGRLAARWNASAASGAIEVRRDGPSIRVRRPVFGGRATETVRLDGPRSVVSLRPHTFPIPSGSAPTPSIETAPGAEIPPALLAPRRTGIESSTAGVGPSLADAAIVVSGGRGLRTPEDFRLVEELASALGAAVGASRAVTDAGWRPTSLQVGQTGRAVSPQLYLAVGISGAIQHLVGMVSSRVIVAINSDASAPIFKVSDYGIVGDLFQIVPALTAEVRRVRGT